MTKKYIFILITILIIISVLAFSLWFFVLKSPETTSPETEIRQEIFPQGLIRNILDIGRGDRLPSGESVTIENLQVATGENKGWGASFVDTQATSTIGFIRSDNGKLALVNEEESISVVGETKLGPFYGQIKSDGLKISALIGYSENSLDHKYSVITYTPGSDSTIKEISLVRASEAVLSPDGNQIFYTTTDSTGTTGIVRNLFDGTEKQVFESAFSSWQPEWPHKNNLILKTKTGSGINGFLYILNPDNPNGVSRVLKNINSLVAITSPNADKILYNQKINNDLGVYVYDDRNKSTYKLSIKTIVDKCLWADNEIIYCMVPQNIGSEDNITELWHQGLKTFSDDLWRINTNTREPEKIVVFPENIDGIITSINNRGNEVLIRNKGDESISKISIGF